jgi:integral membrane sensor domain MASE1
VQIQASDELLTIAEIAIALAGFSGVVVAFAHQGVLSRIDRSRFAALLALSMGAAVVAFVPSILELSGYTGSALWRGSSIGFLVVATLFMSVFVPRLRRISLEPDSQAPRAFVIPIVGLTMLTLVSQLSNALGWPYSPGPALLVLGLLMWVVSASMLFGLLVLDRHR